MNYSSGPSANSPSSKNMVTGTIAWIVIILCAITMFVTSRNEKQTQATSANPFEISFEFNTQSAYLLGARSMTPQAVTSQMVDEQLSKIAKTDGEQIARSIVLRELGEKEKSEGILKDIETKGTEQKKIVDATRRLFKGEDSGEFNSDLEVVFKKIDWFANVATAQSRHESDMLRVRFETRNKRIVTTIAGFGILIIGAGVVGLGLLITGIVLYSSGKLKFAGIGDAVPSAPFVEAFALYLALLTATSVVMTQLVDPESFPGFKIVVLGAMLMFVVAAVYWTKLRGVSQETMREAFGTHPGRGAFMEVLMGIAGYLALLPIVLIGFGIFFLLRNVFGGDPSHPIQKALGGNTESVLIALFLGVVLAPIAEELMFRGALFAHLRKWMPWLAAAALVAIIFAIIHPQGAIAVPVLACVGFNLAIIRYWRGSSIANITAHALNNATVMGFAILISQ